jgi:hypothetical protein
MIGSNVYRRSLLLPACLTALTVVYGVACDKKKDDEPAAAQQKALGGGPPQDPVEANAPPPAPPSPDPRSGDAVPSGSEVDISDEQLDRFARAFMAVQELQSKIEKDLSTAQSPDDAKQLQQKASQQAASIVEKAGLSMTEYGQIAQRLQADEALRERLQSRVQAHTD